MGKQWNGFVTDEATGQSRKVEKTDEELAAETKAADPAPEVKAEKKSKK